MNLNKISRVLRMNKVRPQGKAAIISSALLAILASPVYSEEAEVAKPKKIVSTIEVKNKQGEIEVIEVRGMRGTMTRSLNEKKNNSAIVDAIAAADFGDLPGLSLSDVIENISGASAHRLKGSQNEVSIRGLGSYWGYSTFNGRTITNAGPGRAVNFKKFPSDLVDKVVIYKSQQADLVEGGTSGTIDVNSLRAVDYGKSETSVELGGMYNSYYQDTSENPWGSKFVLSTVQNFETDNLGDIGFTFGISHQDTSNPEENYGGSSQMGVCATRAADGTELSDNGGDCTSTSSSNEQAISAGRDGRSPTPGIDNNLSDFDQSSIFYVPNDAYWRTGSDEDQRTNVVATVQWVPNEQWNLNADVEISRLEYTEERMEMGLDSRRRRLDDHIIAADHSLLYATGEAKPQLSGESRNQVDDYNGFGFNAEFYATDNLTFTFDTAYSESYRYRVRHRTKFKSNDRYDYALDFRGRNVPELTFLDEDRVSAADGGDVSQIFDATDMNSFVGSDGGAYSEYRRSHDEREDDIFSVNFDVNYVLDNDFFSSIKAGVRYSTEHLVDYQTNDVSLTLTSGSQRNGSTDTADGDWEEDNPEAYQALTQGIIDNCQNGHYNNNLFDEETGGGSGSYATYDSKCFQGQMLGQVPGNNGTDWYDIGEREDGRNGSDRDVTEDIVALYAMANIDTEAFGVPLTGNIGVRVVQTDTHSTGWGDKVYITSNADGTFDAETNSTGEIEVVTLDSSYTEVLPSINLSFQVTDDFYVRAAAYQAMSRFQMNAMSSGVSYETCEDEDESNCDEDTNTDFTNVVAGGTASGNHMKPYLSDNFDLSFEYYPSLDSAITLALYHKSFVGGYENVNENRDITVSLDGVDTNYPDVSHSTVQTSDESSTIQGFEVTANKHFVELPGLWSGLGASVAYNYADSDFVTKEIASPGIVPDANLFGFSSNVASASLYWEGDDLSLRVLYKYRSKYFQPNNLPFPTRSHRYVQDSEYLDFAAKYKITGNVSVSLKALNLLNEPQVMTRGNDTTVSDYSRSGAKFYVGVKATF